MQTIEARTGLLKTPLAFWNSNFMPVGTLATVKTLTNEEIKLVSEGLFRKYYHLWQQPGNDIIKDHGGIRGLYELDGALNCRSGFQVFFLQNFVI